MPYNVAIVHDYITQRGGAERVVLELARMWPDAPIYTSLYRPQSTLEGFQALDVRVSPLNRVPVNEGFRALAPLLPAAFHALGTIQADLVISSSSGWAHGVRTAPGALHVVYCHTPAHWLYTRKAYFSETGRRATASAALAAMRAWDFHASHRPHGYIANSEFIRRRIRTAYGRDAAVVHPPVDVDRFRPGPRGQRLLVVSRLLPYKRVDLVVRGATAGGLELDVVGQGPMLDALRAMAGPTVTFHGGLDDADVVALMGSCRAVCQAGVEDFGMVPVEAAAAGKPCVAFAGGGALETIRDGVTGALFSEPTPESFLDAVRAADGIETSAEELVAHGQTFGVSAFRHRLRDAIDAIAERDDPPRFSRDRANRALTAIA